MKLGETQNQATNPNYVKRGNLRANSDKAPERGSQDGHAHQCSDAQREELGQRRFSGVGAGPSTHGLIRRRDRAPAVRFPMMAQQ